MAKPVYLYYQGDIDTPRVNHIVGIITAILQNEKPEEIYFLFSSHGGEVDAGVTLYNFLRAIPVRLTMHNIGTIDSIANVIFVAGQTRYASPHAVFLFHGVLMGFNGNLSLPQVNEIRDRILNNHNTIAGIVCERTKIKEPTIKELFNQGETKTVEFALDHGIIDEVKFPEIPKDATIITININN